MPKDLLLSSSLQMIGGGLLLIIGATITGEWRALTLSAITRASWIGALYLLVFGSLVGYTAFAFLIQNVDPRLVGTYAFVNPAIAFFLAAIAGERVMNGSMIAGAVLAVSSAAVLFSKPFILNVHAKARARYFP